MEIIVIKIEKNDENQQLSPEDITEKEIDNFNDNYYYFLKYLEKKYSDWYLNLYMFSGKLFIFLSKTIIPQINYIFYKDLLYYKPIILNYNDLNIQKIEIEKITKKEYRLFLSAKISTIYKSQIGLYDHSLIFKTFNIDSVDKSLLEIRKTFLFSMENNNIIDIIYDITDKKYLHTRIFPWIKYKY